MDASEYLDDEPVLRAKVKVLAQLVRQAKDCVIYSGAGLSTGAGIGDYASQSPATISGTGPSSGPTSPLCAQPTLAHRVLVSLQKAGHMFRWINQNHDGLPQKAGLRQEIINEIHGAWHAPDNPVIAMSGELRGDLFADLMHCEAHADLCLAVGTSLCGMNADQVVTGPASRAKAREAGAFGSVIISLQRTVLDEEASLRIFGRCDDVFELLAQELELVVTTLLPAGEYFVPRALQGRPEQDFVFHELPYDLAGQHCNDGQVIDWDLRDDTELVIPRGVHAGAKGVIDGRDREGNLRCRFVLKPKVGKLRAPVMLLLGRWWIQAAVDGKVCTLPVVNVPAEQDCRPGAQEIRDLMQAYAGP
eukprot:CAMPEP_0115052976 /NCGR_PEP_ID=MMETSP0227-20121206/3243_1 /TAXON_ID=89957 /ORGANISM="Polarella glacialis, Strain CCMP 1383" /LENGTH=360 /DNA_ID=CAMNT_0002437211 /DNA_START=169 /DNA_END=1251 /DNA_ORIENTATION=+